MRYISTRGQAPALSFTEAMMTGLARDGGLYVPEVVPQLPLICQVFLIGVGQAFGAAAGLEARVVGVKAPSASMPRSAQRTTAKMSLRDMRNVSLA